MRQRRQFIQCGWSRNQHRNHESDSLRFGDTDVYIVRHGGLSHSKDGYNRLSNAEDSYRLVYNPINQGIPIPLTPKTRALTTPVALGNAQTVTQGVAIVLVDLETKAEYISRDSGSINTYNVNITYRGRDFITNQPVTLVVDTQMEMGAFCTAEDLEPETEEEAPVAP